VLRLIVLLWSLVAPVRVLAQQTGAATPIASLGQPSRWPMHASVVGEMGGPHAGPTAALGLSRSITNPVGGLLGAAGELTATAGTGKIEPGVRLFGTSPALNLAAGVDWRAGDIDLVLTYRTAIRRGGIVGRGSTVRVDWLPTRSQALGVGLQLPLFAPLAGRTRPAVTRATFLDPPAADGVAPRQPAPTSRSGLAQLAAALDGVMAFTAPVPVTFTGWTGAQSRRFTAASADYFSALTAAFSDAARSPEAGALIARRARAQLLADVILPYDTAFGQWKQRRAMSDLTLRARDGFSRWVRDSAGVAADDRQSVIDVHSAWMAMIDRAHDRLFEAWDDPRLVWVPPQLALSPDEYDDQEEVDALIARAVGQPFTDDNALTYLRSADLPIEVARSIFAARDYHVLWTHDFSSRKPTGELDEIGYATVADAYLPALTAAVQRYDTSGTLTQFMILLDQFYYESRGGRVWMDLLEHPLKARVRLAGGDSARTAHLQRRLDALRLAVARSARLQREARDRGGDAWLDRVVRVHVSIVLPSDFSYRSDRIIPPFPVVPDNIVRDHRKLAFYDLSDADPHRGALLMMGVGIGDHYASATWEDRGYRVRGPAALEVRAAARRALLKHGVREADLPVALRQTTVEGGVERAMDRKGYAGRALQVHNEAGFGAKDASVARAMLYSLAPAGSVIIVPDPLWLCETWGSMLVAAAARGSQVMIIAPARDNAPAAQGVVMAAERSLLQAMLAHRDSLADVLRANGGSLRVGLYASQAPPNDVAGRRREVREGLARAPWISTLIPFDAATLRKLDSALIRTDADAGDATRLARDAAPRAPQLHQKTQLIARPGAIAALVRQPGWSDVLARTMTAQSQATARLSDAIGYTDGAFDSTAVRQNDAMLRGFEESLSPADRKRASFYLSVGTQNQDGRGLALDGESSLIVSGYAGAAGIADLYYLMARTQWIERPGEIDRYVPAPSGLMARLARLIRIAL
jgi:hypothetical protein